jgi:hypothetical protein
MSGNTKFERVYEDEFTKSVWKYDYEKTRTGPVSVSVTYKQETKDWGKKKTLGDLAKESRKKNKKPPQ